MWAAGFPFDSVKVRLQASQQGSFQGPYHCFRHIVRTEGVSEVARTLSPMMVQLLGMSYNVDSSLSVTVCLSVQARALYRGLSVPLLAGAVETGINYAVYTQSLPFFEVTP